MKRSTTDTAEGTFHEVKGAIEQKVGRALNRPGVQAKGQTEEIGGKLQKKLGEVKRALRK
jgi:uncharacterized protein YjbJ (UPF0337 family)